MEITIHELKTWPLHWTAMFNGEKTFELRKNDRGFKKYDELLLKEYDPLKSEYTGRILHRQIVYILRSTEARAWGLQDGYCILGLVKI